MEKKVVLFVLSIFLVIILSYNVKAVVGVSPGSYEIDFDPNLEKKVYFTFIFDPDVKAELYVEGDLSEYVTLDKESIVGQEGVTAFLKLPSSIEVPGVHIILIGARQLPNAEGMGIVGNVRGVIKVKVPYPGKYSEISFTTANANVGEPVDFTLIVNNLGVENITAAALINIYNSRGEYIEMLNLGSKTIETKKYEKFFTQLNTSNYKAGDYKSIAVVDYGGRTAEAEAVFRLGELYVGISNYTKEFEREKLNKFEIEAESFWNDPIEEVYARVVISNYSIDFLTPSMRLSPWSKVMLTGFFDTTPVKEDGFQANITLNYRGKTTNKIVNLELKKEVDYTQYIVIGAIAGLLAALIIVILILLRVIKKAKKIKKIK